MNIKETKLKIIQAGQKAVEELIKVAQRIAAEQAALAKEKEERIKAE